VSAKKGILASFRYRPIRVVARHLTFLLGRKSLARRNVRPQHPIAFRWSGRDCGVGKALKVGALEGVFNFFVIHVLAVQGRH